MFKALTSQITYGIRTTEADMGGKVFVKSFSISKMNFASYSCQTQHLRDTCIHYSSCLVPSLGIPKVTSSDEESLSLCLLRNGWRNESGILELVAGLSTTAALTALKLEVMQKLNVLGGTFSDSDTVSVLSNACPSMVASKIFHISAPSTITPSAGLQREWYSRTQFSVQEFKLITLNGPSLSSDVAETFWAHPTTNIYKGVNISNCAKINITIVASKGSVISWYLKPESAQAAGNTVKYGHELGYYATGPVFKSHKYCIPHGNYRFVAKSRLVSGWGSIGTFSVSCQQFERLEGNIFYLQKQCKPLLTKKICFQLRHAS